MQIALTQSALRKVMRMDRAWMALGKMPLGLCAAALHAATVSEGVKRTKIIVAEVRKQGHMQAKLKHQDVNS
jgi:transcription initiation factor TFIIIB Brf1 subunit/transcription initiation factor TFIIB